MKKTNHKKLALSTDTIRVLTNDHLARAVGGSLDPAPLGFIMKDTIIVRTSR
jgi:hypothetical protein